MALPAPRRGNPRRIVVAALATGAVALIVTVAVIVATLSRGPRPEEAAAEVFLDLLLAGDGVSAYALTTPDYRAIVFERELDAIADVLAGMVGPDPGYVILGSERTIGSAPLESLVGYQGATPLGTVEGVVTLLEVGEEWLVRSVSHRFPDADPAAVRELEQLLADLNAQLSSRAAGQAS